MDGKICFGVSRLSVIYTADKFFGFSQNLLIHRHLYSCALHLAHPGIRRRDLRRSLLGIRSHSDRKGLNFSNADFFRFEKFPLR